METNINVLLIEDNPGDVRLIEEILSQTSGNRFSIRAAMDNTNESLYAVDTSCIDNPDTHLSFLSPVEKP